MNTRVKTLIILATLILPTMALAVVPGSGFDGMTPGTYAGGATITGDASRVQIVPADEVGGAAPPNASGNIMVIDNRGGGGHIKVSFTFNCGGPAPNGVCQVSYDFFFASYQPGAFIGVFTDDDGGYGNPDDWFQPPVGLPPSTAWGDNMEGEYDCTVNHTLEFIISPGAVAYLDNFGTDCLEPVSSEGTTWDTLKSMYR